LPGSGIRPNRAAALGLAALAVAFVALAGWSWRKWADVQIDFGNQLYLPWQLTRGLALYRDIEYKEGPLSIYANAALFEVFGTSLRTLIWVNLVLFAGLTATIHALFARACDVFTATVCCLVLLVVFGFSQYEYYGDYNYILPYTQEQTHGLLLGVVTIACLGRYLERRTLGWAAAAGVSLGMAFLTKAELFVPAAAAALVGAMLAMAAQPSRPDAAPALRAAAAFVAGMLLPPLVGFALLASSMPVGLAARGVAGNWAQLSAESVGNPFYFHGLGFDDVPGNLRSMALASAAVIAVAAAAAAVDRLLASSRDAARFVAPAVAVAATVAFLAASRAIRWQYVGLALPPLVGVGALAALAFAFRARSPATIARFGPLAMWAVYAFVLLGKMILAARIWGYGFTLAMPGTLLLVAGLVSFLPAVLRARGSPGVFARAFVLGSIAACTALFFWWSNDLYARKNWAVGSGADLFYAENSPRDPRAGIISAAAEQLRALMPPDATLLVLPEGTILNYLLRRSNPTRHTLFIPTAFAFFGGEAKLLEDLRAHPPDFIALVHRETGEFGVGYFGADPRYGQRIRDWVRRDYTLVRRVGAEPFQSRRFGVAVLRRISPPGAPKAAAP
jgi:hypothetical protein